MYHFVCTTHSTLHQSNYNTCSGLDRARAEESWRCHCCCLCEFIQLARTPVKRGPCEAGKFSGRPARKCAVKFQDHHLLLLNYFIADLFHCPTSYVFTDNQHFITPTDYLCFCPVKGWFRGTAFSGAPVIVACCRELWMHWTAGIFLHDTYTAKSIRATGLKFEFHLFKGLFLGIIGNISLCGLRRNHSWRGS